MCKRCDWALVSENMKKYHDEEWGVPVHDDRKLFEFITLDAFQAGLSWQIILNKRERFREQFDDFDPGRIALYNDAKVSELLKDKGIIRNRMKIEATINNAKQFLKICEDFGSFDDFIWSFVNNKRIINRCESISDIPARSIESDVMSKDLKKRGFKFAGTTICYAFMQAAGLVNDHLVSCFRYSEV